MLIDKAQKDDLEGIMKVYNAIHDAEEKGLVNVGWKRDIYPILQTASDALTRGDLFVLKENNRIVGTAIINQVQLDSYAEGNWLYSALPQEVMVLHTLVIDPLQRGKGYGSSFVNFYENYAIDNDCHILRMDTQEKNISARKLYAKLGYREAGVLSISDGFNGLPDIKLVLLEKQI